MTAVLIDGKALALKTRGALKNQVDRLKAQGVTPGLAVILVGGDHASQIYVRNKIRACDAAGIRSVFAHFEADLSEADLLAEIRKLNADPDIHGILVQLPLPKHIHVARVIETIDPAKDVDGFHLKNVGALVAGLPGLRPCTPVGCMRMLASVGLIDLSGKTAVVIGRSDIVGKPMALLLLAANATVTICHSRTPDLGAIVRRADIVIAAVGRARVITSDMIKPGAVVIDVGINRAADGSLCGDVDYDRVREVAGALSPVPGGVGPMTIAMLLANTVQAAEQSLHRD